MKTSNKKVNGKIILIFCEFFLIVQWACIFNLYDTDRAKEGGWPHSGSE